MTKSEIIEAFKSIGITLYSGGVMDYDLEAQKKIRKDYERYDYEPIRETDNFFRFKGADTPYLVVDTDGIDFELLESKYPSLRGTFYTTTTAPNRRHYYLLPPEGESWTKSSSIRVDGEDYDLLVNYVIFEGHAFNLNPNYAIMDNEPKRASKEDFDKLNSQLNFSKELSAIPREFARRFSPHITTLVKDYIRGGGKISRDKETLLVRYLYSTRSSIAKKKILKFKDYYFDENGKPIHTEFNYLAWRLTYTELSYQIRNKFIDLLLKEHGIDPNSELTREHLDKSIYATLPAFKELDLDAPIKTEEELRERLKMTSINEGFGILKTQIDLQYRFLEVDISSLTPRDTTTAVDKYFSISKLEQMLGESVQDFVAILPEVKTEAHPYRGIISYDEEAKMPLFNTVKRSVYYLKAVASDKKPSGLFNKALDSILGDYRDFYDHWLAYQMYSSGAVSVSLVAVSGKNTKGHSGKSFITATLPSKLIPTTLRISEGLLKSNFSVVGISLQVYNDIQSSKIFTAHIHSHLKDNSTGGAPKVENIKYSKAQERKYAVSFAVSANFYPTLDGDNDRRLWVIEPQHLSGKTEPLTDEEANTLYLYSEGAKSDEYLPELQDYANYLKYLYEEKGDKYYNELHIEAPRTPYFDKCLVSNNPSKQFLNYLRNNPEGLLDMVPEDMFNEVYALYKYLYIVYNNTQPKGSQSKYIVLPLNLLDYIHKRLLEKVDISFTSRKHIGEHFGLDSTSKDLSISKKVSDKVIKVEELVDLPEVYKQLGKSSNLKVPIKEEIAEKYKALGENYKKPANTKVAEIEIN